MYNAFWSSIRVPPFTHKQMLPTAFAVMIDPPPPQTGRSGIGVRVTKSDGSGDICTVAPESR